MMVDRRDAGADQEQTDDQNDRKQRRDLVVPVGPLHARPLTLISASVSLLV